MFHISCDWEGCDRVIAEGVGQPALFAKPQVYCDRCLPLIETLARLDQLGAEIVGDGPQPFDALLKTDLARWAKVIKTADIKLD